MENKVNAESIETSRNEENINRSYNIFWLIFGLALIVIQVFGLILVLFCGAKYDNWYINVIGEIKVIKMFVAGTLTLQLIIKFCFSAFLTLIGIVIAILALVNIIKSIKSIIKLFSLNEGYFTQRVNFNKYRKFSNKILHYFVAFFFVCFLLSATITAQCIIFLVFVGIVMLALNIFEILYKDVNLKRNQKETALYIIERIVLFFFVVMLICSVDVEHSSVYVIVEQCINFGFREIANNANKISLICNGIVLPICNLIINIVFLIIASTIVFRTQPLVNTRLNKLSVNAKLFVALFCVVVVIVAKCIIENATVGITIHGCFKIIAKHITAILAIIGGMFLKPSKVIPELDYE